LKERQGSGCFTMENEMISQEEIDDKVNHFIENYSGDISMNSLLASFFTEYGVLCKSHNIINTLRKMEQNNHIEVIRDPPYTKIGKVSAFFTEGKDQNVTIRRKHS
jgi:hypothetical protein